MLTKHGIKQPYLNNNDCAWETVYNTDLEDNQKAKENVNEMALGCEKYHGR